MYSQHHLNSLDGKNRTSLLKLAIVSIFRCKRSISGRFFGVEREGMVEAGKEIKDGLVLGALKPHLTHPFGLAISHTNNKGKSFGTNAFNCA